MTRIFLFVLILIVAIFNNEAYTLLRKCHFAVETNVRTVIELKVYSVIFVDVCHVGLAVFQLVSNQVMFRQYRSPDALAAAFCTKVRLCFHCNVSVGVIESVDVRLKVWQMTSDMHVLSLSGRCKCVAG